MATNFERQRAKTIGCELFSAQNFLGVVFESINILTSQKPCEMELSFLPEKMPLSSVHIRFFFSNFKA